MAIPLEGEVLVKPGFKRAKKQIRVCLMGEGDLVGVPVGQTERQSNPHWS